MEIFKDITFFKPNKHTKTLQISNFGNIKRITHKGVEKIHNGSFSRTYKVVRVNYKKYSIHRLVLEHFIEKCPDNFEADHINRVRTDNHIDNLRWVSKSDNNYNRVISKKGCLRKNKHNTFTISYKWNKKQYSKSYKTIEEAQTHQLLFIELQDIFNYKF
jgi:hypothetical protein